ncbi:hypothetical protein DEU56DRAFT_458746 [Suillus clintonianus]|uniref:uncharacterized protein n=1 Tax=Suillus clintonianus TaxID=1904413 RepID=UPI001B86C68D|nr:uncharacterized protein DEU56DRAFT_458746 [Suillus clintonianus]KAG2131014.1 hypothetical protein DEU56DRAFT_458746 [Suillus clintonianus]
MGVERNCSLSLYHGPRTHMEPGIWIWIYRAFILCRTVPVYLSLWAPACTCILPGYFPKIRTASILSVLASHISDITTRSHSLSIPLAYPSARPIAIEYRCHIPCLITVLLFYIWTFFVLFYTWKEGCILYIYIYWMVFFFVAHTWIGIGICTPLDLGWNLDRLSVDAGECSRKASSQQARQRPVPVTS